ncbi:GTP cyclohydrolase 1 type 2/Nif3 [Abortiporus biennis]|nr:GTP cyclohydrolase 1 type 2/Nif3 [Abortiporus biennis]
MPRFKLVFFSPVKSTPSILNHLFAKFPQEVGKIGEYESCAFMSKGTGQFRPGPEANPAIGTRGELESVDEHRVEVVVNDKGENKEIKGAIDELKKVHPYEEVAYDVYRLEDF